MSAESDAFYSAAAKALEEADYILFGHDDHFVHLQGDLTDEEIEKFSNHMQAGRNILLSYVAEAGRK